MSEQRYRAVLEVQAGVSVTEVADRYGVSRQSVHAWLRRYRAEGASGLVDRSHRPVEHPWRLDPEVESAICELRREHRRWGPRRLVFEMDRRGWGVSRSTVYRTLVRNGLLEPRSRRRRRDQYRRWERAAAMELWQMDVTASAFLVDGTELKIVTGIDDHSRYCVMATVVRRATARPVCQAFVAAMVVYGVPEEILTDNGKVFTGRFHKPGVPVEVLFDRICRENGIHHRLTRIHSPTTTGKIERLHATLQTELLEPHGPFKTPESAQQAIDGWRDEYNRDRPHQSLDMAFPATRFTSGDPPLGLRVPAQLSAPPPSPAVGDADIVAEGPELATAPTSPELLRAPAAAVAWDERLAVEVDRVVPPSGNVWIGGQQLWLGPALAGRSITIWVDQTSLHLLLDGARLKTVPSRLGVIELSKLAAGGARPAGPSPLPTGDTAAIELDRTVNALGLVSLAGRHLAVGSQLAGRRITLRMEQALMAVTADGQLLRTMACPVPPERRHLLRGARRAGPPPAIADQPLQVQRRVSERGGIMVATQKIQVGMIHARNTVTVIVDSDRFQLIVDGVLVGLVPRTTTKEVHRYKIYAVQKTSRARQASSEAKTSSIK